MKPVASLSLDLDNKWSYMKTHGDTGWESFPSYLDVVVPRILEMLGDRGLTITFFIVGQDAELEQNRSYLRSIAEAGHEIGNHSFHHEPWLHLYSKPEIVDEFERSESAIEAATGQKTIGFRGPGYSLSPDVLEVLSDRGYVYDCSTFPTYIAPLARIYYFLHSPEMTAEEREKRKKLFGKFSDGFQTLRPHLRSVYGRDLVEIPVSTFPIVKSPIHASYIIYLATYSKILALAYWRTALFMFRTTGIEPSLLLHPLDFMSGDDAPELKFFPGMDMPLERKLDLIGSILRTYAETFEVTNMIGHAETVLQRSERSVSHKEASI